MLEASFEFSAGMQAPLIDAVLGLSSDLRPTRILLEEGRAAPIVALSDTLQVSLEARISVLLEAPCGTFNISAAARERLEVRCFLDINPDRLTALLIQMAVVSPVFAFACTSSEHEQRNLVKTRLGQNAIEIWVGRDTQQYIPGLYWLTLLSSDLANRHRVPLSTLERLSMKSIELPGNQHLFKFYDTPLFWKYSKAIADTIATTPGIFHVDAARTELQQAKDFVSLQMLAKKWP